MSSNNNLAQVLNILRDEVLILSEKGCYGGHGYHFEYVVDDICLEFDISPRPFHPTAIINISSENNNSYYFSYRVDVLNTVFKRMGSRTIWFGDFHFKVLKQKTEINLVLEIEKTIKLIKEYDQF